MSELESKLDGVIKDIEYIREFIEEDRKKYSEHLITSENYRGKVIRLEEKVGSLAREHVYYRWLFGIIISVGVALLLKP